MCFCDLIEREGLAYDRAKAAESQAIENEGFRNFQRSRISDHFMDEIAAQCQRLNENLSKRGKTPGNDVAGYAWLTSSGR